MATQPDPIGLAGGLNLYGYAGGDPINPHDPLGLCPRITVSGKDVRIEANLETSALAPADALAVRAGIKSAWSGSKGGYNVSVNLDRAGAPVFTVYVQPNIGQRNDTVLGRGGSRGPGAGGDIGDRSGLGTALTGLVAGHEFGHGMMLEHVNAEESLMNKEARGGAAVSRKEMQRVISKCRATEEKGDDEKEGK